MLGELVGNLSGFVCALDGSELGSNQVYLHFYTAIEHQPSTSEV